MLLTLKPYQSTKFIVAMVAGIDFNSRNKANWLIRNFWNEAMEENAGSEQQNGDVYGNKNGIFTISKVDVGDSHLDL